MTNVRKLALLLLAGTLSVSSCAKKDANVEADYATKKASAETLVTQINTSMATMKTDHQNWITTLDQAAKKPGVDTAKINNLKQDMDRHDKDGQTIMALVDSVKLYTNVTGDNADQMKAADDRLGSNYNDLSDKWKNYQDTHNKLQQDVQQFAVNTAGNAVQDTMKANAAATKDGKTTTTTTSKDGKTTTTTTKTTTGTADTKTHHEGGAARNPSGGTSSTTTTTPQTGTADTKTHHEGGATRNPSK